MAMTAAYRRYRTHTWIFMGTYVALNVGAIIGVFDSVEPPGTWLFALAVGSQIAAQIWAMLVFIRDSDEYIRAITAKRFIAASGLAMALFSIWGFGESYADAPHVPGWMIYPLFWLCFGAVSPFLRKTRA